MTDIPGRLVNVARFQIDKVGSNTDPAAGGPLSTPSSDSAIVRHIQLVQELATLGVPIFS